MIHFFFSSMISLVPSQAREYVESLHQNQKDVLIYGKNNVKVAPKDKDTFLPGYLSFHKIITNFGHGQQHQQQQETTLVLKWTPNQLMNGHTTQEKSASWQQALYIDLKTILFIHCHQVNKTNKTQEYKERSTLVSILFKITARWCFDYVCTLGLVVPVGLVHKIVIK